MKSSPANLSREEWSVNYTMEFFLYYFLDPRYLFLCIPPGAVAWFVVSLCQYVLARTRNSRMPGFYPERVVKMRKYLLILSSVVFGVVMIVCFGLFLVVTDDIAYM